MRDAPISGGVKTDFLSRWVGIWPVYHRPEHRMDAGCRLVAFLAKLAASQDS